MAATTTLSGPRDDATSDPPNLWAAESVCMPSPCRLAHWSVGAIAGPQRRRTNPLKEGRLEPQTCSGQQFGHRFGISAGMWAQILIR